MAIKNDMEFLVWTEVRRRLERSSGIDDVCGCPLCEFDILALALNQLPTPYCHEIGQVLVQAASVVRERPHH